MLSRQFRAFRLKSVDRVSMETLQIDLVAFGSKDMTVSRGLRIDARTDSAIVTPLHTPSYLLWIELKIVVSLLVINRSLPLALVLLRYSCF